MQPTTPRRLGEGIHADIDMADYIADPCPEPSLSSGIIKTLINETPLHARYQHPRLDGDPNPTVARIADRGSVAHELLLGGGAGMFVIEGTYTPKSGPNKGVELQFADYKPKAARELRDQAYAEGKVPVFPHEVDSLNAMVDSAKAALAAAGFPLEEAETETTFIWNEDGVWCRTRTDMLFRERRVIIDYKTTVGSAATENWIKRSLYPGRYDVSAAMYARGAQHLLGSTCDYLFLVGETKPPYGHSLVGIANDMPPEPGSPEPVSAMDLGRQKVDRGIEMWRRCMTIDEWPSYPSGVQWVNAPTYEVYAWEAREFSTQQILSMLEAKR